MSDNGDYSDAGASDNGDNSNSGASDIGPETTPDFGQEFAETDSGYHTKSNSATSSTETLNHDDSSRMDIDSNSDSGNTSDDDASASASTNFYSASASTISDSASASTSYYSASASTVSHSGSASTISDSAPAANLQCNGCRKPYDSNVVTGDCGHNQCSSCWKKFNCLCSTCNKYSEKVRSTFPPECIDEPMEMEGKSKNNGVLLKDYSSKGNNATTAKTWTKPSLNTQQTTASTSASVRVKCMNGANLQETINPSATTVDQMKRTIHQKTGISYERQNLLHQGKTMTNSRTLSSYNVANGSTIQMAERCSGG